MIKIYGLFTPNFLKVVYAAEELELQYQVVPVNLTKGESRTPEHRKRHPFGKVPVIEHEGQFLFESNAIVRYMGNLASHPAYPSQSMARAQVDQWLEYFAHQAGRWCTGIWFQKYVLPKVFKEQPDEKRVADFSEWLLNDMPTIDAHLSRTPFVAGSQFSLADVVAHTGMQGFKDAGLPLGDYKNFIRWFDDVDRRPSYRRAKAAVEKAEAEA